MRLLAALQGDLKKIIAEEAKAAESAVTNGVRQATDGLKLELRGQVTSAGLGQKLANTWRGQVYPKGGLSLNAAGFVFSKAPQIIGAFGQGVVIRSSKGFYLAIPTAAAGKSAMGKRITPGRWEQANGKRLRFVFRRNGPSLLVADDMRARTGKRGGLRFGGRLNGIGHSFILPFDVTDWGERRTLLRQTRTKIGIGIVECAEFVG